MTNPLKLGLLGGTFDPIHAGHLAMACSAREQLQLDRMVLLPAGNPWQRRPRASAQHRLQMTQLAARSYPFIQVDEREIHRSGPTFTVDTLHQMRLEYGPEAGLYLILGADAFHNLPSWQRWQTLFSLCHVAVIGREPLDPAPDHWPAALQSQGFRLCSQHPSSSPKRAAPAGSILLLSTPVHPASSTHIRNLLRQGLDTNGLLPKAVLDYIEAHHLYQQESDGTATHQG